MKYKHYVTDAIRKWWNKQNFGEDFQKKLQDCELSDSKIPQDEELSFGIKITRVVGKSGRPTLAWMKRVKDEATVYVLRAAYTHDKYESAMGKGKLRVWAQQNELTPEEEIEVDNVLEDMLRVEEPIKEMKPSLSEDERMFISKPLDINQDLFKDAVYETKTWVDYVQCKGSAQFDFFAAASEIEEHIVNNVHSKEGWQEILCGDDVISIYHKSENWILDKVCRYDDEEADNLSNRPEPTDFRRGYPFSYLSNRDDWQRMELDKKSNMVLSKDQVAIVAAKTEYPLFITGRAGSGKSTMLQYLFAEMILRYISQKKAGAKTLLPPVYLSYSENLIQDAKSISQMLLEKNSRYREASKKLGVDFMHDVKPGFDGMFFVFQSLVKNCIRQHEPEYLSKHFANSQYISFSNFNSKWNLKFGNSREANKKYGPSLCWHVIRTYIKGWDSAKLMTPADYAKLPKNRKTVSDETFATVYDKVWSNWYANLENAWDDQDLVRYCLDKGWVDESFSGVFCDEAQDFTRLELDFILKLSCFSNRTVDDETDIKKLPFVFAGDEFQTLNPTGFSWDSLRSYFAERLGESTGLATDKNAIRLAGELELSENFRSTRQVVKLANHIQLLRATRFDSSSSKPQSPHFSQEGSHIVCLSPSDANVFERLRNREIVLIVPAADGVSACEYIANSPLKDMIEIVDGIPQGLTVLNPTQAKGLEYPNVAVYGFDCKGAFANLDIKALTKWYANPTHNEEVDIELKYQLSNAYVAVTRASNKLFIIDDFDIKSFWAFAYAHPEYNNSLITPLKNSMLNTLTAQRRKQWPEDLLGWIVPGNVDDITNENVDYMKSEENRAALEKRAEALRDSELMRQAACRNKEAGLKKDEDRCWAKALSYEEQFEKAAEFFVLASEPIEAVANYWWALGKLLTETPADQKESVNIIAKIAGLRDKLKNDQKVNSCFLYRQKTVPIRDLKLLLDELFALMNNEDNDEVPNTWNFVVNGILPKIQATKKSAVDVDVILDFRTKLGNMGIEMDTNALATIAYKASCIESAIALWEEVDEESRPKEYVIEKANLIPYPERISFLMKSNLKEKYQKMMIAYRKNSKEKIDLISKVYLGMAFSNTTNFSKKITSSEKKDLRYFLPAMLAYTDEEEYDNKWIKIAISNDILKDPLFVNTLTALRYGNKLTNQPPIKLKDLKAKKEFESLLFVDKVRNTDFVKRTIGKNRANDEKINGLVNAVRKYAYCIFTPLVVIEVGKVLEARGFHSESVLYYDLVRSLSDSEHYFSMVDVRRWYNMERLAENNKDKQIKTKAAELRKQLELDDCELSEFADVDVTLAVMEELYDKAMDINCEVIEEVVDEDPEKDDPIDDQNDIDENENQFVNEEESTEQQEDVPEQLTLAFDENDKDVEDSDLTEEKEVDLFSLFDIDDESPASDSTHNDYEKPDPKASKQSISILGYNIYWIPKKEELHISYNNEDEIVSLKVSKGKIAPFGLDVFEEDGAIFFEETDLPTPFELHIEPGQIALVINDGGLATGMRFVFETSNE